MLTALRKVFKQGKTQVLGDELFAIRASNGLMPDDCIAFEIREGERGTVEFSGILKASKQQTLYLINLASFLIRFAPDPAAPEYGIELEVTLADKNNPPEALAYLFTESMENEALPKQINTADLAAAITVACGDDVFLSCMSEQEWEQACQRLSYRLGKRYGLMARNVKQVMLKEADAALQVLADNEQLNKKEASKSVIEELDASSSSAKVEAPTAVLDEKQNDTVLLNGLARSFRLHTRKLRSPSFRPDHLDKHLQQRMKAQLPPLGRRIAELAPYATEVSSGRVLRDLRDKVWAVESSLAYLGELKQQANKVLDSRATRRRLTHLRDASDALESLICQVTDIEQAEIIDSMNISNLGEGVELLQAALARRAFEEVK